MAVFVENKCSKVCTDWAFYCHHCSQQEFSVICSDCYDKSKHVGHDVETVVCETGVPCDCGNDLALKSDGFCAKHCVQMSKAFDRTKNRSFKGSASMTRKLSEYAMHRRGKSCVHYN